MMEYGYNTFFCNEWAHDTQKATVGLKRSGMGVLRRRGPNTGSERGKEALAEEGRERPTVLRGACCAV